MRLNSTSNVVTVYHDHPALSIKVSARVLDLVDHWDANLTKTRLLLWRALASQAVVTCTQFAGAQRSTRSASSQSLSPHTSEADDQQPSSPTSLASS